MFLEGKKYACDACVRGHRVSGCNHSDRPLQEIAKKGRPVSQCQHCRTLRKSRSSHVKCDCGDKLKGIAKHHFINENGVLVGLDDTRDDACQCPDGGRCNCSIKKEQLDAVPEFPSPSTSASTDAATAPLRKPKLQTTQSDGCLTKFANGHHKPVHRHHNIHTAAPYHIPPHHVHSGPIVPSQDFPIEADFALPGPLTHVSALTSSVHPPLLSQELQANRQVKSEDNSPDLGSTAYAAAPDRVPPLTLSRSVSDFSLPISRFAFDLSLQTDISRFPAPEYTPNEYYYSATGSDTGNQISAPFLTPTSGWPAYESNLEPFYEIPPGLTQSVSGDDSEIGEIHFNCNPSPIRNTRLDYLHGPLSTDSSDLYESDEPHGISTQSSMVGLSQLAIHPSTELGPLSNLASVSNLDLTSIENTTYPEGSYMEPSLEGFSQDKQYESEQYAVPARDPSFLPDSEVFMMYQHNPQNAHLPSNYDSQ